MNFLANPVLKFQILCEGKLDGDSGNISKFVGLGKFLIKAG